MPAIPPTGDFNKSTITKDTFHAKLLEIHAFLTGLLGSDGVAATARGQLGLGSSATKHTGTVPGYVPLWESLLLNGTVEKTADYTVQTTDRGKLIDFTGAGSWTLSTASGLLAAGVVFAVRNSGTGVITINPYLSEQIDGASTITLAAGESCIVAPNDGATGWVTVGKSAGGGGSTGQVAHFAMNTAPTGWLKANGAAVSRTSYAALFAAIGTTFGVGDGSTTFNLPDLRGEFVRGWDDARGVDSGRTFGSAQTDEFKSHTHGVPLRVPDGGGTIDVSLGTTQSVAYSVTSAATGSAIETRPRNIALLACIKY